MTQKIEVLPSHSHLAEALCTSVTRILLPATHAWFRRPPANEHLRVRVGRGRATYCQQQRDRYTITFGVRMVAEKCQPEQAAHWMTAHEMQRRGYGAGQPTVGELLAHTACHEFAHLVQQANGWWRRGSVHNAAFYETLDRLHESGAAREVHSYLSFAEVNDTVDLGAVIPVLRASREDPPEHNFRRGDRVCFRGRGGREIVGCIQRINRITATVIPEDRRFRVTYYRVPFHLLQRVEA